MEFSRVDNARFSGGYSGGDTPVPIPNTAVKPARADGTWRVTSWESRSPPGYFEEMPAFVSTKAGISMFNTSYLQPITRSLCSSSRTVDAIIVSGVRYQLACQPLWHLHHNLVDRRLAQRARRVRRVASPRNLAVRRRNRSRARASRQRRPFLVQRRRLLRPKPVHGARPMVQLHERVPLRSVSHRR